MAQRRQGFTVRDLMRRLEAADFSGGIAAVPTPPPAPPPAAPEPDPAAAALLAARAEAFAEGVSEGDRRARAELDNDRAALAALLGELGGRSLNVIELAPILQKTVLALVGRLVGDAGIAPELIAARIDTAMAMLADATEPATVHLHPADHALASDMLPTGVAVVADAGIERGAFRLETPSTLIDDGPALWLEQLSGRLDRMMLPG
jgi:flagellar assembly protein FliH